MKKLTSFIPKNKIKACLFDFDGVFTDNYVYIDEKGGEMIKCTRYDGFGIASLRKASIFTAIISTEIKDIAKRRGEKLKIPCYNNISNKLEFAISLLEDNLLSLDECAFVGNDVNDLDLLKEVLLPICPPNSHETLLLHDSFYTTALDGGSGCVREVADFLTK